MLKISIDYTIQLLSDFSTVSQNIFINLLTRLGKIDMSANFRGVLKFHQDLLTGSQKNFQGQDGFLTIFRLRDPKSDLLLEWDHFYHYPIGNREEHQLKYEKFLQDHPGQNNYKFRCWQYRLQFSLVH